MFDTTSTTCPTEELPVHSRWNCFGPKFFKRLMYTCFCVHNSMAIVPGCITTCHPSSEPCTPRKICLSYHTHSRVNNMVTLTLDTLLSTSTFSINSMAPRVVILIEEILPSLLMIVTTGHSFLLLKRACGHSPIKFNNFPFLIKREKRFSDYFLFPHFPLESG